MLITLDSGNVLAVLLLLLVGNPGANALHVLGHKLAHVADNKRADHLVQHICQTADLVDDLQLCAKGRQRSVVSQHCLQEIACLEKTDHGLCVRRGVITNVSHISLSKKKSKSTV